MHFSSLTFLFFFLPISIILYVAVYFIFKKNVTVLNILLCALSLIFYAWGGGETALKTLFLLLVVNYFIGYLIGTKKSKTAFLFGIIFNCLILITSKYPVLLLDMFSLYMTNGTELVSLSIPLGISFIVFSCISYIAEEYYTCQTIRKADKESKQFLEFSVYILLFTKILQGPIVQFQKMLPSIKERKTTFSKACLGIERFVVGLAKKVLIADVFRATTTKMIATGALDVASAWLLVLLYGLQLYFDFSGYSDMALGLSKVFGFDFAENFNFPYISTSISEFWRRWHISLGDWFKRYVYIPLGGNRSGNVFLNLFVVFVLTGIWHGNSTIFLCWGIAHGILILIERTSLYQKAKNKWKWFSVVGWLYTTVAVFIGWTCFWVGGFTDFVAFMKILLGLGTHEVWFTWRYYLTPKILTLIVLSFVGIGVLSNHKIQGYIQDKNEKSIVCMSVKYLILILLFVLCFMSIIANGYTPFLYFVF